MTRYTKYRKTFNTSTIAQEQHVRGKHDDYDADLSREERLQVERDKRQSVEALRSSRNLRSKPVLSPAT